MRAAWLLPPALLLLSGCAALDPGQAYREAARRLSVSLEGVEPDLHLAFPLEKSRIVLRLQLRVDNPSSLHLKARGLRGDLSAELGGQRHAIGRVALARGLDLPAAGSARVPVELSFTYAELKEAWAPLQKALRRQGPMTWFLDGQAELDLLGLPLTVPIHARKHADGR